MDKSSLEFGHIRKIYERNNRSNQMKALRCFPGCKPTGHTTVGFCGSSLKAVLNVYIDDESPPCQKYDLFWTQILYIAEIRCSDEDGLSNRRYVLKSEILPHIRSKSEKYKPFIKGECIDIQTTTSSDGKSISKQITLEFNSEHNAWHYGWMSHRYSSDKTHVIDVMILVEPKHDNDCFFLAGSFLSTAFTVVSTKRSRAERRAGGEDDDDGEYDSQELIVSPPTYSHSKSSTTIPIKYEVIERSFISTAQPSIKSEEQCEHMEGKKRRFPEGDGVREESFEVLRQARPPDKGEDTSAQQRIEEESE